MAATVKTMYSSPKRLKVNVTGAFSIADETDTKIIDRSTLTALSGGVPNKIVVEEITWSVGVGFDYVLLEWDDGTDEVIEYLSGQGYMDFRDSGGKQPAADPGTADEGDILLSTSGGAAGDVYSIYLNLRLKD